MLGNRALFSNAFAMQDEMDLMKPMECYSCSNEFDLDACRRLTSYGSFL